MTSILVYLFILHNFRIDIIHVLVRILSAICPQLINFPFNCKNMEAYKENFNIPYDSFINSYESLKINNATQKMDCITLCMKFKIGGSLIKYF